MITIVKTNKAYRCISIGLEWGSYPLRFYIGIYKWVIWLGPNKLQTGISLDISYEEKKQ